MPISTKRQEGAASIEFVIVFVLFFMLFYGMVTLAFPLLLSATYEELSAEALREAITFHPYEDTPNLEETVNSAVNAVIENSWLPSQWAQHCKESDSFIKINGPVWSVCISHNDPSSILPKISLFGFDIVNLPAEIRGEAIISF